MKPTATALSVLRKCLLAQGWHGVGDFAADPAGRERARRALNALTRAGLLEMRVESGRAQWRAPNESRAFCTAARLCLRHMQLRALERAVIV